MVLRSETLAGLILHRANTLVEEAGAVVAGLQHIANAGPSRDAPVEGTSQSGANGVCFLAETQLGKTTIVHHLAAVGMDTEEEYSQVHRDKAIVQWPGLEASLQLELLAAEGMGGVPDVRHFQTPTSFFKKTARHNARRKTLREEVRSTQKYHLDGSTDSVFKALSMLWPKGGHGRAGSTRTSVVSGAHEFQVLSRFQSPSWAQDNLKRMLQLHSRGLATDTNPDKDIQIDLKYLQQLWTYLTPAGTDVGREAARFASLGPDGGYLAPIKPWLCRLLGSSLLFRSRIAAAKPCLHTELMFVGDVMNMHLITDLVCSSGSRSCEPSPEQERVLLLMAELAKQDPKGPWGEARAMCKDPLFMQAFSACISHLHLFIPNQLLLSHNLQSQFHDSTGIDDENPVMRASQRELEEKVQSLVLMASRDLSTVSGLLDYTADSPFLGRWLQGQLDPGATSKPFFSAMISLERVGLTLPLGSAPEGVNEQLITGIGWLASKQRRAYIQHHFQTKILPKSKLALQAMLVKALSTDDYDHMRASGLVPTSAV
ncbi:MAG: hypothetical protein WDW38_003906 [Sanguina aurantia]